MRLEECVRNVPEILSPHCQVARGVHSARVILRLPQLDLTVKVIAQV